MLQIKLKILYQIVKNKCKLIPFPGLLQVDYDRRFANLSFPVLLTSRGCFFHLKPLKLKKLYSKHTVHKHTVIHWFSLKSNGSAWGTILTYILTHKITEDHLTLSDGGLFLSNIWWFLFLHGIIVCIPFENET